MVASHGRASWLLALGSPRRLNDIVRPRSAVVVTHSTTTNVTASENKISVEARRGQYLRNINNNSIYREKQGHNIVFVVVFVCFGFTLSHQRVPTTVILHAYHYNNIIMITVLTASFTTTVSRIVKSWINIFYYYFSTPTRCQRYLSGIYALST